MINMVLEFHILMRLLPAPCLAHSWLLGIVSMWRLVDGAFCKDNNVLLIYSLCTGGVSCF